MWMRNEIVENTKPTQNIHNERKCNVLVLIESCINVHHRNAITLFDGLLRFKSDNFGMRIWFSEVLGS